MSTSRARNVGSGLGWLWCVGSEVQAYTGWDVWLAVSWHEPPGHSKGSRVWGWVSIRAAKDLQNLRRPRFGSSLDKGRQIPPNLILSPSNLLWGFPCSDARGDGNDGVSDGWWNRSPACRAFSQHVLQIITYSSDGPLAEWCTPSIDRLWSKAKRQSLGLAWSSPQPVQWCSSPAKAVQHEGTNAWVDTYISIERYVYTEVYTYIQLHTCIQIYRYANTHVYTHKHIQVCIYIHMYMHVCEHLNIYI